jgi:DNA-binding response OmpR family regulator
LHERYGITPNELRQWKKDFKALGVQGLRAMGFQHLAMDDVLIEEPVHAGSEVIVGEVTIDFAGKIVVFGDLTLHIPPAEFKCLEFLARRQGSTQSKRALFVNLYREQVTPPNVKTIDVFICNLRRHLKKAGMPTLIETVSGIGYVVP